jgi:NAD(P)-dependent dehydrogenase (short-subunit alcohol dehydrogenase family)
VEALSRRVLTITADFSEPAEVVNCVERTLATFGSLDVLVHYAGGPAQGGLLEVDPCIWYKAFDIHVHAVYHLARAVVPSMIESGGGAILLMSSAAGKPWLRRSDCLRCG